MSRKASTAEVLPDPAPVSESVVPVIPLKRGANLSGPGRTWKGGRPKTAQGRKKVEGDGVLRAMRHVLVNTRGYDTDRMEKAARQWLEKDQKGFILKLHEMEMQEKALLAGKKEDEFLADPGTEKTLLLIDRLIKDAKEHSDAESRPIS